MDLLRLPLFALAVGAFSVAGAFSTAQVDVTPRMSPAAPKIFKIDPPNWWAQMPKPMLLIRGENLSSARLSVSDSRLKIAASKISENGHWAELWLSASPAMPETVTVTAKTGAGHRIRDLQV